MMLVSIPLLLRQINMTVCHATETNYLKRHYKIPSVFCRCHIDTLLRLYNAT